MAATARTGGDACATKAKGAQAWTGLVLAAAALLVISVLSSGVALAHAAFVRSEPAPNSVLSEPPGAVTIWFTEAAEPGLSEINVLDASSSRVSTEAVTVLPGDPKALTVRLPRLPNGVYTVAWKAFSAVDGHSLSGSFVFSVGVPLAQAPVLPAATKAEEPLVQAPAEVVLRWLGLLSILAVMGCLVFELFISRPLLASDNASEAMQSMDSRMESRTLSFVGLAAGIFLAATIGELLMKTSAATGASLFRTFGRPVASVLQTDWGNLWVWRVAVLFGMIIVLMLASRDRSKDRLSGRREWEMVALAFSAGILFTIALVSHGAATSEIRTAAIFSDYLHLLAASVWIGGIFYLALVIPPVMKAQRKLSESKRASGRRAANSELFCPENHVTVIARYSTLAMLSVGTLFITGLYSSWAQVTTLPALATPYGKTLLIKLGLIVPLLLLGTVNLLWVRPRLAHDGAALRVLRKTITAEAVLAALVILSVGSLVGLETARQVASRQELSQPDRLVVQKTSEGVNLKIIIEPGTLGPNPVTIFLTDRSGRPITNATAVTLQLTYLDGEIAPFSEATLDHGGGIWVAHEPFFSVAGNWQASLVVQRPGAFDARTSFQFRIPLSAEGTVITLSAETGRRLFGIELALLGFLFGGVGLSAGGRKTRAGMAAMALGAIAIVAGLIVALVPALG
ncbi:MAG: copper resistance protein CopC [Chloroflexi bacterium]|nr:copper resistance protein CopC [Chloroflexota bacterium]